MIKMGSQVFFIYHYDDEGHALVSLLALILKRLGVSTVAGRDLVGRSISDEVRKRIESSNLIIVLLTREPSNWIVQEITWAVAHHVPCLFVIQGDVNFDLGIAGDLEQLRFAPGEFAKELERIVLQVETLLSAGLDIPPRLPRPALSDPVRLLILRARAQAKKGRWGRVLRLSDEALALDPGAVEAAINKGAALMSLNRLKAAERVFQRILSEFPDTDEPLLSKVYYNLATVEEIRNAGRLDEELLRRQAEYLEKSLALDHKNVCARASLALCQVALKKYYEATSLVEDSLKCGRRFRRAFRLLVETKGAEGHLLLGKLPGWIYSLLFPSRLGEDEDDDIDDNDEDDSDDDAEDEREG